MMKTYVDLDKKLELTSSTMIIQEQVDDDKGFNVPTIEKADLNNKQKITQTLQDDASQKKQFLVSEDFNLFEQVLVVSQIRMDCTNDDPFLKHLFNVEKAIRKASREILIKLGKIQNKQQFKDIQQSLLRVFYGDINIGFITSTGQIKSTAFIYMNQSLVDILNRQKLNLQFKKIQLKITLSFFGLNSIHYLPATQQQQLIDIKQSFICNNKFNNEFLILSQTNQDELKDGVSIFFVYRHIDDQIYAVKRVYYYYNRQIFKIQSRLQSQSMSFFDVFQTCSVNELTSDQRRIREAKILSKLNHTNILTLFNWWIEHANGAYFLYMQLEYCSFPGFKHQTTDLLTFSYFYLNPLPDKQKLAQIKLIMGQILDALEYIHRRGVVHRDLKPENVFVTIGISGDLQVMLADFDQGKDVREAKLSGITNERLDETYLNSVMSENTVKAGTSGYQNDNYGQFQKYDQCDEFYAMGITLLHLVLTFPGEPKNRNHYAKTIVISPYEEVLLIIESWAIKFVKNRHKEFRFANYENLLKLSQKLLKTQIKTHQGIRDEFNKLDN